MKSIRHLPHFARQMTENAKNFWKTELWQLDPGTFPPSSAFLLRITRVLDLVGRGIRRNDLRVIAAGLTYMTLLSLVPFVAIAIWILKALDFHSQFIEEAKAYLIELPPHFQNFLDQTLSLVEQTNFAQLGIVGATVLVLTTFGLLGNMESSFNKIWGISKHRGLLRRWTNYISFLILLPIIAFSALTLAAPINPFGDIQGKLGSLLAVWLGFSFIYSKLPNTQVRVLAFLSAGFVTACLWLAWLWVFTTVQPGVTRYNIIYGTLSFLPAFLAWLYVSWVIVVLGCEIANAIQHEKSFQLHREGGRISVATQMAVALAIMIRACRAFSDKEPAFEANVFSQEHRIPFRFLQLTLDRLVQGDLLIRSEDHDALYVLGKNPELISTQRVIDLFLNRGRRLIDLELDSYIPVLKPVTQALGSDLESRLGAINLKDLASVDREQS